MLETTQSYPNSYINSALYSERHLQKCQCDTWIIAYSLNVEFKNKYGKILTYYCLTYYCHISVFVIDIFCLENVS
jgi:hypothetical protein